MKSATAVPVSTPFLVPCCLTCFCHRHRLGALRALEIGNEQLSRVESGTLSDSIGSEVARLDQAASVQRHADLLEGADDAAISAYIQAHDERMSARSGFCMQQLLRRSCPHRGASSGEGVKG